MSTARIKPSLRRSIGLSLEQAKNQLDWREFHTFYHVWRWSSPRIGGADNIRHDQFYAKFGREAYYARINKVRSACGFDIIIAYRAPERFVP